MKLSIVIVGFLLHAVTFTASGQTGEELFGLGNGGRIAYQYLGRVTVDFTKGTGVVYGYLTQLAASDPSALFNGQPSERSARLTFRADITFQPLQPNGDLGANNFAVIASLIAPGTFRIYNAENVNRNWSDPSTFSSGTVVAEFARSGEMFTLLGAIGLNTASASLASASPFSLGSQRQTFRRLTPRGTTNVTVANGTPLLGSSQAVPTFAFTGYATVIGL